MDLRSRTLALDKLSQRKVGAFPCRVLVHYVLLHLCCGQCFSLTSFTISPSFLWASRTVFLNTSFWCQPERSRGLPAMATVPLEPVSNPFLLMWQMVSVWSGHRAPWSPCSLPLVLVFSMSFHVWGESCEDWDAYLFCSCVGISAATHPRRLHAEGRCWTCLPPTQ